MKKIIKRLSLVNVFVLFIELIFSGLVFISPATDTRATDDKLCSQPVDIVMILDRSGSMDYTSRCDWWQFTCIDKPACNSYDWQPKTDYNVSQSWCDSKTQSSSHQSVYLAIDPKKIIAAQEAANNFLALMGAPDQSALVSYANTATLDKGLSSDHLATETAVNNLIASGATNIGDALKLGIQELNSSRANAQANHVMILLTDGKANKPYGPGYGEYLADVNYAQSQAETAAALGFKIFTIGLGEDGEINETMLQNIATATGASYYHSPSQTDLEAIYNSIAWQLCQYGSISGCVYDDQNNNGFIDEGESPLNDWTITLNNSDQRTQETDANGCYTFAGLENGSYTISEIVKSGWQQTFPLNNQNQQITLTNHEDISDVDFANYQLPPTCGDNTLDNGEQCDDGNNQNGDGCSSVCQIEPACTDVDNDGYFAEGNACGPADCDDSDPSINPNAPENCDGFDNNCDSQIDENFSDLGSACSAGIGLCSATGIKICAADGQSTVCDATAGEPAMEICDGSLDENCDGTIDENCQCANGATQPCGPSAEIGVCRFGTQTCIDGAWSACLGSINPIDETCDGLDNDCDGESDETFSNLNQSCTLGVGKCQAAGNYVCSANFTDTNCNAVPGVPDAEETCDNNIDDDCDGQIDENCLAAPYCGDNIKNDSEECDGTDGVGQHQSCSAQCLLITEAYCGDGQKNNNEECDSHDGLIAGFHCNTSCRLEKDSSGNSYGNLKIYKYLDADGDLSTTIDQNLATSTDWHFIVNSALNTYNATTTNGFVVLNNLFAGTYTVEEEPQLNWYLLGTDQANPTVVVFENQETTITFYNAARASLSGYTFEDQDGLIATATDRLGQNGWLISLFDSSSSSSPVATTTTDASGFFEFKNLLPGDYQLTETLQSGWQQLSAPATPLTLITGQISNNNNFINYYSGGSGGNEPYCGDGQKNNQEECDGADGLLPGYTCSQSCTLAKDSSGGGSSGGGGIGYICGNGIREGAEVCDQFSAVPSGYLCNAYCTAYEPITGSGDSTGSTNAGSTGQNSNPTSQPAQSGEDSTQPNNLKKTNTGNPVVALGSVPSRAAVSASDDAKVVSGLIASAPAILGVKADACARCPWWIWPLLAILHLAILITYLLILSPLEKNNPSNSSQPNTQNNHPVKNSYWWLPPIFILLAVIFFILVFVCEMPWLTPTIMLASFLLMLLSYQFVLRSVDSSLARILVVVFLTIAPIAAYLYCPWEKIWFWLAVIASYLFALICLTFGAIRPAKNRSLWGWFILAASLLIFVLEWLIEHCQC